MVRDLAMHLYVCIYIYIYIYYIYPSQSTIVALIDCAIGKMVRPIRRNILDSADRRIRHANYVMRTLLHSEPLLSARCSQTWPFISILCTISTTNTVSARLFTFQCML